MKKIAFLFVLAVAPAGQVAMSQNTDHVEGGHFLKRVEYNVVMRGVTEADNCYNLDGKSIIDRILFGSINSPVEFVFEGSSEGDDEVTAFRIVRDLQTNLYRLEVMRMPDTEKVYSVVGQLSAAVSGLVIPPVQALSLKEKALITEHNRVHRAKFEDVLYKPYHPDSKTVKISDEFAEKLHSVVSKAIGSFKARGIPPIMGDGYRFTFRCVVEDEVWTLTVHEPRGRTGELASLLKQLARDAEAGSLDEQKYAALLKNF
ncbi:MAG: hypothetical protein LBH84_08475 [Prevotellaceae bacterium]|jgi:hypothetical protein|nr:hypothetical protein [Prevotellaceae bacterium]